MNNFGNNNANFFNRKNSSKGRDFNVKIHIPVITQDSNKRDVLFSSIREGNLSKIKTVSLTSNAIGNMRLEDGSTLLHELMNIDKKQLSEKNKCEIAKYLINQHVPVSLSDKYGVTPLHLACKNQESEMVELLINSGANVNVGDINMMTPFHYYLSGKSAKCESIKKNPEDELRDMLKETKKVDDYGVNDTIKGHIIANEQYKIFINEHLKTTIENIKHYVVDEHESIENECKKLMGSIDLKNIDDTHTIRGHMHAVLNNYYKKVSELLNSKISSVYKKCSEFKDQKEIDEEFEKKIVTSNSTILAMLNIVQSIINDINTDTRADSIKKIISDSCDADSDVFLWILVNDTDDDCMKMLYNVAVTYLLFGLKSMCDDMVKKIAESKYCMLPWCHIYANMMSKMYLWLLNLFCILTVVKNKITDKEKDYTKYMSKTVTNINSAIERLNMIVGEINKINYTTYEYVMTRKDSYNSADYKINNEFYMVHNSVFPLFKKIDQKSGAFDFIEKNISANLKVRILNEYLTRIDKPIKFYYVSSDKIMCINSKFADIKNYNGDTSKAPINLMQDMFVSSKDMEGPNNILYVNKINISPPRTGYFPPIFIDKINDNDKKITNSSINYVFPRISFDATAAASYTYLENVTNKAYDVIKNNFSDYVSSIKNFVVARLLEDSNISSIIAGEQSKVDTSYGNTISSNIKNKYMNMFCKFIDKIIGDYVSDQLYKLADGFVGSMFKSDFLPSLMLPSTVVEYAEKIKNQIKALQAITSTPKKNTQIKLKSHIFDIDDDNQDCFEINTTIFGLMIKKINVYAKDVNGDTIFHKIFQTENYDIIDLCLNNVCRDATGTYDIKKILIFNNDKQTPIDIFKNTLRGCLIVFDEEYYKNLIDIYVKNINDIMTDKSEYKSYILEDIPRQILLNFYKVLIGKNIDIEYTKLKNDLDIGDKKVTIEYDDSSPSNKKYTITTQKYDNTSAKYNTDTKDYNMLVIGGKDIDDYLLKTPKSIDIDALHTRIESVQNNYIVNSTIIDFYADVSSILITKLIVYNVFMLILLELVNKHFKDKKETFMKNFDVNTTEKNIKTLMNNMIKDVYKNNAKINFGSIFKPILEKTEKNLDLHMEVEKIFVPYMTDLIELCVKYMAQMLKAHQNYVDNFERITNIGVLLNTTFGTDINLFD